MQSPAKSSSPSSILLLEGAFPDLTDWQGVPNESTVFRAQSRGTGEAVQVSLVKTNSQVSAEGILRARSDIEKSIGEMPGVERIIGAHDLEDGSTAVLTPYMEGETLEDEIQRGAIHWDDATWMTGELASILARLHRAGVTYGALHPRNVFLVSGAVPILRSLELSILGRSDEIAISDEAPDPFMPPELQRSPVAPTVDVYGLGAALRAMLAGNVGAFHATTATNLPAHYGQTPVEILAVINTATAQDPSERYADASKLSRALEPAVATSRERERTRSALTFQGSSGPVAEGGVIDLRQPPRPSPVDRRNPRSRGVFDRPEPGSSNKPPTLVPLASGPALVAEQKTRPPSAAVASHGLESLGYGDSLRSRAGLARVAAVLVIIGLVSLGVTSLSRQAPEEIAAVEIAPFAGASGPSGSEPPVAVAEGGDQLSIESSIDNDAERGARSPDNVVASDLAAEPGDADSESSGIESGAAVQSSTGSSRSGGTPATAPSSSTPAVPPATPPVAPVAPAPVTEPSDGTASNDSSIPLAPVYEPPFGNLPPQQLPTVPTPMTVPSTIEAPTSAGATSAVSTTLVPTTSVSTTLDPTTAVPTTGVLTTGVPTTGVTTAVPTTAAVTDEATVLSAVASPDFESVRIRSRTADCASMLYSVSGGGVLSSDYGNSCVTDHSVRLGGVPYNGTQLRPSTAYTVTIRATSRSGQVSTRKVSFTTKAQPVAALSISNLRVSEITATTARVSFTANKCVGSSFVVTGGGSGRYDWGYPNTNNCLTDQWGTIGYFQSSRLLSGADNTVTVTARTKDGESVTRSITFFVPAS